MGNKNIIANIFRVQENDSGMCVYFSIRFIDLCLQVKDWVIWEIYFFSMTLKKNDNKILSYFKDEWNWQKKLDWSNKIHAKRNN